MIDAIKGEDVPENLYVPAGRREQRDTIGKYYPTWPADIATT